MGLSLSTSAAPELSLEAFDAACRARGLDGEELVLDLETDVDALVERVKASGARVVALRVKSVDARSAPALARASARLDVPVSVSADSIGSAELSSIAAEFERAGGRLMLGEGSNLDAMIAVVSRIRAVGSSTAIGVAWEIRPSSETLDDASACLFAVREFLGLVRLHGGGPEQREQEGLGIGALLVDLALSKYTGPTVMCPSRAERLPKWGAWLESRKSAGCGSKAEAEVDVLSVDVRDVEPRDRLGTILGAYKSLRRGGTMKLTVDHDPSCMYHTLNATEPEGSFTFRKLEDGPEVWGAEVTKL
jgi:uncharacterized protein (DUF2249 family)